MAQELGISEKHSDFQNPFKVDRTEVSCWGLWPCLHCVCRALGGQDQQEQQHLEWSVRALDLEPEMPGSGSNLPLTGTSGQAAGPVLGSASSLSMQGEPQL